MSFGVGLGSLGGAVGVMYYFLMIGMVLFLGADDIMLDVVLVGLCETFELFFRVVPVDGGCLEVLGGLRGGYNFGRVLRINFWIAFIGNGAADLLDLLGGFPLVLGGANIFVAHRTKIIYKLFYTLY